MEHNERPFVIAEALLDIGAVFLRPEEPFTWASGIKSPIYCDNRLILTAPEARVKVEEGLASLVKEKFPEVEVLMGTATAGIAHAAIVGHILDLPMGYVRSGSKDHGRQNKIEGKLLPGQKVVVIEDLISTGGLRSRWSVPSKKPEPKSWVLSAFSLTAWPRLKRLSKRPVCRLTACPTLTIFWKSLPKKVRLKKTISKGSRPSVIILKTKAGLSHDDPK
jgi:orotate phosphoribosyltransferase